MRPSHQILQLTHNDVTLFKALLTVFEDVFEMKQFNMPDDVYLRQLISNSHFMVFVAMSNEEVIGGLTAYILPSYYFKSSEVYVYDLAIQRRFQRQGLGKNLMTAFNEHCKKRGFREVFIQADLADKHALDFYRAIGGVPESVVHFYYPL